MRLLIGIEKLQLLLWTAHFALIHFLMFLIVFWPNLTHVVIQMNGRYHTMQVFESNDVFESGWIWIFLKRTIKKNFNLVALIVSRYHDVEVKYQWKWAIISNLFKATENSRSWNCFILESPRNHWNANQLAQTILLLNENQFFL